MTDYFDLHFHPTFKKFITNYEAAFPTQRNAEELEEKINLKNKIAEKVDDWFLHILHSQSAVGDCISSGVQIGNAALANLEYGFANSRGFLASILKSSFTKPMDQKYFELVERGEISYYRMMLKELDLYRQISKGDNRVEMICRKLHKNLDSLSKNSKLKLLISLEGGHNLSRLKVGQTLVHDSMAQYAAYDQKDSFVKSMNRGPKIGINPAESFKDFMQLLWDNDMDMMYMTITHLTHIAEQNLATHAFGLKMLQHSAFYPTGNGISRIGYELIKAFSDLKLIDNEGKSVKAPVLADIKHLGLKSRMDLYAFRKSNNIKDPLVASHMGVTGYSVNEWKEAIITDKSKVFSTGGVKSVEVRTERKSCGKWGSFINNQFSFNPWSINLMDEDIVEVISSNGLIGVNLDVRIIGFQSKIGLSASDTSEFLSTSDFQTHFPNIRLQNLEEGRFEMMQEQLESWTVPTKEERHPLCLCFNIIHIVNVAMLKSKNSTDPWNHICIGSDYDGMIEPMKICYNVTGIDDLEYNLLKWLPIAAKAYYEENGGVESIQHELTDLNKLKSKVRKIMFENGKRFVNNWLAGKAGAV